MARASRGGSRVDAALLVACALLAVIAMVLPSTTRDAVAAALQRSLARPFLSMQQRSERARAALLERDRILARLDTLTLQAASQATLEAENASLRRLLGVGARLRRGFVAAEALHGSVPGESHTLLLTEGAGAGIATNSPVVAADGLVGRLTSVSPTTSHAILWSHPDFRVSAMSAGGETFGIVTPHLGDGAVCRGMDETACAGPSRLLLEMRGVAYRDALDSGTVILSSGLGGVFPRGIRIGTVIAELKTTEQWTRSYLVLPAVRPSDVSSVLVLSPTLVTEDLSGMWTDPEAARARALAAGDSLARAMARDSVVPAPDSTGGTAPAVPATAPTGASRPATGRDSVRRP